MKVESIAHAAVNGDFGVTATRDALPMLCGIAAMVFAHFSSTAVSPDAFNCSGVTCAVMCFAQAVVTSRQAAMTEPLTAVVTKRGEIRLYGGRRCSAVRTVTPVRAVPRERGKLAAPVGCMRRW